MHLKMYRCRICGETYLGHKEPGDCPFCGAHVEFFVAPEKYDAALNSIEPTEAERADLESSIELERANTRFYLGMTQRTDNDTLRSAYKRLAKVEAEHCSLFCKLAGVAKPADLLTPGETTGAWLSDIAESLARETRATAMYSGFAMRATSPRLREVWEAVAAVEADHVTLDEFALKYV